MANPLTTTQIIEALAGLSGWQRTDDALVKSFTFPDFKAAFAFMNRVCADAERLNHHPEWTNVYNRVDVRLTTHDAGHAITALDVELAQVMEREAVS